MKKKVNPWAVCTAKFGRDSKKYEECVMAIKREQGIEESLNMIKRAIVNSVNHKLDEAKRGPQGPAARSTTAPAATVRGMPVPRYTADGRRQWVGSDGRVHTELPKTPTRDINFNATGMAPKGSRINLPPPPPRRATPSSEGPGPEKTYVIPRPQPRPEFKPSTITTQPMRMGPEAIKALGAANTAAKNVLDAKQKNTSKPEPKPEFKPKMQPSKTSAETDTKERKKKSEEEASGPDCIPQEVAKDPNFSRGKGHWVNKPICKADESLEMKIIEGFANYLSSRGYQLLNEADWSTGEKPKKAGLGKRFMRWVGNTWLNQTKQVPGLGWASEALRKKFITDPQEKEKEDEASYKKYMSPEQVAKRADREKRTADKQKRTADKEDKKQQQEIAKRIQDAREKRLARDQAIKDQEREEQLNKIAPIEKKKILKREDYLAKVKKEEEERAAEEAKKKSGWVYPSWDRNSTQLFGNKIVERFSLFLNELSVETLKSYRAKAMAQDPATTPMKRERGISKASGKIARNASGRNTRRSVTGSKSKGNEAYIKRGKAGPSKPPMSIDQINKAKGTGREGGTADAHQAAFDRLVTSLSQGRGRRKK